MRVFLRRRGKSFGFLKSQHSRSYVLVKKPKIFSVCQKDEAEKQ